METETKKILVACRCGWQGEQRQLLSFKLSDAKYCPACARLFKTWPVPNGMRETGGNNG
jgi:hypothetical protein